MKNNTLQSIRVNTRVLLVAFAALGLVLGFGFVPTALAATLTPASVTLSDSRPDATSVSYDFQASNVTTSNIQCIQLVFDTDSDGTGGLPADMDISGAGLDGSSDYIPTPANWSPTVTSNTVEFNEDTTGESPASGTDRNFIVTGITNGSVADTGYFLLFNTYDNQDCSSDPVDSAVVQFIFTDGTEVSLTVDPAFTFTVNGVDEDEDVNDVSVTTTVTTTSDTVPFGLVDMTGNQIAAQDLTISTNAQNGYNIYVRYTGAPQSGSNTIDDVSHPFGTPGTFPSPGTEEAFGFTIPDFTADNWAALQTDNLVAANNPSAFTGDETTRIGYQVGIDNETAPGTYTTTIIYTGAPTY